MIARLLRELSIRSLIWIVAIYPYLTVATKITLNAKKICLIVRSLKMQGLIKSSLKRRRGFVKELKQEELAMKEELGRLRLCVNNFSVNVNSKEASKYMH